jgi:prevent-host-death family protein
MATMKTVRIAELKNNLSRYVDHVRAGGSVLVLDRNRPVARLVPLRAETGEPGSDDDRLARLERQGLIRRGTGGRPPWLGRRKPVRLRGGLLKDLLADRAAGW